MLSFYHFPYLKVTLAIRRNSSEYLQIGVSICSLHDNFSRKEGRRIATLRAYSNMRVYTSSYVQAIVDTLSVLDNNTVKLTKQTHKTVRELVLALLGITDLTPIKVSKTIPIDEIPF